MGNLRNLFGIVEIFIFNVALFNLLFSDADQILLLYSFFNFKKNTAKFVTTEIESKNLNISQDKYETKDQNFKKIENSHKVNLNLGNTSEMACTNKNPEKQNFYKLKWVENLHEILNRKFKYSIYFNGLFLEIKFGFYSLALNIKSIFKSSELRIILTSLLKEENFTIIGHSIVFIRKILAILTLSDFFYVIFLVFSFIFFQILALILKNKNLCRKNFHFLAFFLCLRYSESYFSILQFLIYIDILISRSPYFNSFIECFLKQNIEKDSFSFLLLLASITYPYFFLPYDDYMRVIISICILDSFCSITGIYFKSKRRTFKGFFVGQICSYITEFILFRKVDFIYHLIMGIIEFNCPWDDNIVLSISGVLIHKIKKYI